MSTYRNSEIYVSDETMFYLRLYAKMKTAGTNAVMTADQAGDSLLRERLTTEYPQFALAYEEHQAAKANVIAAYRDIEERAVKGISRVEPSAVHSESREASTP